MTVFAERLYTHIIRGVQAMTDEFLKELGLKIFEAGFFLGGAWMMVRALDKRVSKLEEVHESMGKDFVPRSELEKALDYIRDLVKDCKSLLQAYVAAGGQREYVVKALSAAAQSLLHFSQRGMVMLEGFEQIELKAYDDVNGILTIGWGHTGPDVHPGQVITRDQAIGLLLHDVGWAEDCVRSVVLKHVPLNQNQYDALVIFTFNVGASAFSGSTLAAKLVARDYAGAAGEFGRWVHGRNRQILQDLVDRRKHEKELFEEPVHEEAHQ